MFATCFLFGYLWNLLISLSLCYILLISLSYSNYFAISFNLSIVIYLPFSEYVSNIIFNPSFVFKHPNYLYTKLHNSSKLIIYFLVLINFNNNLNTISLFFYILIYSNISISYLTFIFPSLFSSKISKICLSSYYSIFWSLDRSVLGSWLVFCCFM